MTGRTAGRPPSFSEDGLSRAATRIIDRDGLDALTLSSAAAELNVTAMALYRLVESKADLLSRVPDHLLEGLAARLGTPDEGVDALRRAATNVVTLLEEHPNAIPLFARPTVGPNMAAAAEICIAQLVADGISPDRAGALLRATFALVFGLAAAGGESAETHFGPMAGDALEVWLRGVSGDV